MFKFFGMLLGPFGRADQALLFGVPAANHDSTLGLPALLEERAKAVNGFQHGGGAAVGVDRSVGPGVAMVAHHHPIVRILGAFDFFQ